MEDPSQSSIFSFIFLNEDHFLVFTVNIGQKDPAQLTYHLDPPLFIEAAPYQHWLSEPFVLVWTSSQCW